MAACWPGTLGGVGCGATPGRCAGGGAVHPSAITIASTQAIMAPTCEDRIMWVIYLEALLAVSLVLLIVWWTMRGK